MGWEGATLIAGRVLIAALFAAGAVQKALDPAAAGGLLAERGLPEWIVHGAMAFNAAAALALVLGWRLVPVAFALAAYCGATSVFHLIPTDPWQMSIFVKNWAIAGGCLCLAVAAQSISRTRSATASAVMPKPS
jgi:putative oxidoreductase